MKNAYIPLDQLNKSIIEKYQAGMPIYIILELTKIDLYINDIKEPIDHIKKITDGLPIYPSTTYVKRQPNSFQPQKQFSKNEQDYGGRTISYQMEETQKEQQIPLNENLSFHERYQLMILSI